jgi:group I intron endonuclease
MKITIYIIRNLANGKVYVGQSKRFETRISQHFRSSRNENCPYPIGRAIRKYGKQSFSVEIIEEVNELQADERERHWISSFESTNPEKGYNLESGGNSLKSLSDETRKKISESRREWYANLSEEELERYCQKRKGIIRSEEGLARNKAAVLQAIKGVKKTPEHCEKIRQAHLTRVCKPQCRCAKCVPQLKIRESQVEEMRKLFLEGMTENELAERYSRSVKTIKKYLQKSLEVLY